MKASCGCGCECGCGHAHVHDHADGHAHNHDHDGKSGKRELMEIGAAACIFAVACIFKGRYSVLDFLLFFSSYLILGGEILIKAGRNLVKGEIFDENFLMSIATLAAFATGDFAEAVGVMLFFRIGEWFEHLASDRSRSRIMEAVDLRPETVRIADDNGVRTIPAAEANPGDILVVKAGDRIPLDAIVTEGVSRIDTSAVTGEPVPVKVGPGDAVTSGCVNMSGVLKVKVEKVLEDSMVTRILHSVENAAAGKPKIDRFITKFSRVYTPAVVAIAILTAIVPPLFLGNFQKWIYTAITFLVISCPCALVLSIPLTFFAGIGAGAKKGILFKDGRAIESLSRISAVVLDKTGTVTKGEFAVTACVPEEGYDENELLGMAAACETHSGHPIAGSILSEAKKRGLTWDEPDMIEEISGKGIRARDKDGELMCGNKTLLYDYGADTPGAEAYVNTNDTVVYVARNGRPAGRIFISDVPKEDAVSSIDTLKAKGIRTVMMTGDEKNNAIAIAGKVGVKEVYAGLLPEEKLEKMREIRSKYGKVLFVGDGINDAPVLAGADVGAAMGSGADAAIEAADVVFMTSGMTAIPDAIRIAKKVRGIATENVAFALAVKALIFLLGFAGHASLWMAVFADTGVAMLCILNSIRLLCHDRMKTGKPNKKTG